jgi:hypothetical protein
LEFVVPPGSKNVLNLSTKASRITCILLPCSRNFCNLPTKASQIDCILSPRSENFYNLPTKATQINCALFCCAAKNFAVCQQKHLKLIVLCSSAQRRTSQFANKGNV